MATQEEVIALIHELLERDAEGLYNDHVDTYEYEEPGPLLAALAESASGLRSVLAQAARVRSPTFGGRAFPTSFVDFLATLGCSDILDQAHAVRLWLQQLDWELRQGAVQANGFTQTVRVQGRAAHAFEFVDNPGDMPAYGFVALLEMPTNDDECLWLYRGWDLSWRDGILLAPMGRTFWDVAYLALTGLADALYVPSGEFEATLDHLRGRPEGRRAQLEDLARLTDEMRTLPVSLDETYTDDPFSWETQLTQLDARIARLRNTP